MNAAVAFDVVPVDQLRARGQVFACVPYAARITGTACLARQALAADREAGEGERARVQLCGGCALGAQVAAQLAGAPATAPTLRAAAPGHYRVGSARVREKQLRAAAPAPGDAPAPEAAPLRPTADAAATSTCTHPEGCTRPRGRVVPTTRPERATWCKEHRLKASWNEDRKERAVAGVRPADAPPVVHHPGATCAWPGCTSPQQGYRAATVAEVRPFCRAHRVAKYHEIARRRARDAAPPAPALAAPAPAPAPRTSPAHPVAAPALDAWRALPLGAVLEDLLEAYALVQKIGPGVCRALAARIDVAATEARGG